MKVLGVDIGSYSIKVAEFDLSGKGYVFSNYQEFLLSNDPNRDSHLEIIETLRNLATQHDSNSTKWVIAVPQSSVSVHNKKFPFRERQKILKSLPFELEDEIPFDIDDSIFDAKVVEVVGDLSTVLTVACPRESVKEALDLAKDGGFDPDILSVEGLALANCFEDWSAPPPDATVAAKSPGYDDPTMVGVAPPPSRLVMHIGHKRTLILGYRGSELIAVRSTLWGGLDIADSLSRTFSLPILEAIQVLKTKAFVLMNSAGATRDQLAMSQAVSSALDPLMQELRLILLELRSNFATNFTKIELFGGVSLIQNLCPYVTKALETPTNLGHHLNQHKNIRVQMTPLMEASSGVAIGLALEAMRRSRNPAINLRKGEFVRENKQLKQFWQTWRIPIQVGLTAFAAMTIYSFVRGSATDNMVQAVDERLKDMATTIAGLKGAKAGETGVEKYIKTQKVAIKNREELQGLENYTSALDILAKLSEKLPVQLPATPGRGIDVSHLNINNDDVTLEGHALTADLMPKIDAALKEIARPKSVNKQNTAGVKPGPGTAFSYRFKVNRKP